MTSNAWEVAIDDVENILKEHGIRDDKTIEAAFDMIDGESVEDAVLHYVSFHDQVAVAHSEIEDQLMKLGFILHRSKKFYPPQEDC